MISAVIFDMDGLLIDSEPLWRRAQAEVYSSVGINLTKKDMVQTMGKRIDEVVAYWYAKRPWTGSSQEEVKLEIINRLIELVQEEGIIMPGVIDTLDFFRGKEIPMAIASSSSRIIIEAVVDSLDIRNYFVELFSAEHETHGKPHPAVFIRTAEHLNIAPTNCLVFEDSPSGVLSAKAAKMKCIAIPDKEHFNNSSIQTADTVLESLDKFNLSIFNRLN